MDLTSGLPFWPVRDGLIRSYPRLAVDLSADVAVIGGGITGAMIAYHLAKAGIDCVVVDKRDIGTGSTSASTALLQYEIDTSLTDLARMLGAQHAERAYLACHAALGRIEALVAEIDTDVGYQRSSSLYAASSRRDARRMREDLDARRRIGLDGEWLEPSDIAKRFSFKRHGAILTTEASQVDAYALTHALLHRAEQMGVRIYDRTNVTRIDQAIGGVRLSCNVEQSIRARQIVFATGYESHAYLHQNVGKLVSTYAIASEPLASTDGWGEGCCQIWESARPYLYLRGTPDGRVMVGGEDVGFRSPLRRDRLIGRKADTLGKRFREMFPRIPLEIAYAWTGTFCETTDGLAYIGETTEWPNSWFALAFGGNGITYSILAAEIIRDGILGRDNENADLFRFDR